jgi:hypothetical protein
MKQNNVFIMWVPFGAKLTLYDKTSGEIPKPVKKEYDKFSQQNCQADFQGGDNGTVFTVCDAGSDAKGMARIFQVYFHYLVCFYGRWTLTLYRLPTKSKEARIHRRSRVGTRTLRFPGVGNSIYLMSL